MVARAWPLALSVASGLMMAPSSRWARTTARYLGVSDVLERAVWPAEWPYSPNDFKRQDETDDRSFYSFERFCYHVDDRAVAALTRYYDDVFRGWSEPRVLDICSSHVSHFPDDCPRGESIALGMNKKELEANPQVDDYVVHDLNVDPTLPFDDDAFDVVTCAVSIDYLTKPKDVCVDIARVLKPGGAVFFALSNRCFPTKAIDLWLRTNDLEHVFMVGSFLHYSGKFKPPTAVDVSPVDAPWIGGTSQNPTYLAVVRADVDK